MPYVFKCKILFNRLVGMPWTIPNKILSMHYRRLSTQILVTSWDQGSLSELKVVLFTLLHSNLIKQKKEFLACITNMCKETDTNLFVLVHFHVCIGRLARGHALKNTEEALYVVCSHVFTQYHCNSASDLFPFEKWISNKVGRSLLVLVLICMDTLQVSFVVCARFA